MNIQTMNVEDRAELIFKQEMQRARGKKISRLIAVNDACMKIVRNGGMPTTKGVISLIATVNPACNVAASTIDNLRNSTDGSQFQSSYKNVINAWILVASAKKSSGKKLDLPDDQTAHSFISKKELFSITDKVLRHKVSILIGQADGHTRQAEIVKAVRELSPAPNVLGIGNSTFSVEHTATLSLDEFEILEAFYEDTSTGIRGLIADDVGALTVGRVKPGVKVSKPGLMDLLGKIIQNQPYAQ